MVKINGLMKRFTLKPCDECIIEFQEAIDFMKENKTIEVTITELSDSDCLNKRYHFICFSSYTGDIENEDA